ncbi:hypothetical protein J6590_077585 [Homalodisca vitripennis]|nr:hypothetical protein J6590_077585 [Homalodisca vitripennis]
MRCAPHYCTDCSVVLYRLHPQARSAPPSNGVDSVLKSYLLRPHTRTGVGARSAYQITCTTFFITATFHKRPWVDRITSTEACVYDVVRHAGVVSDMHHASARSVTPPPPAPGAAPLASSVCAGHIGLSAC